MEVNNFSDILNADNCNKDYFNDLISYGSNRVMPILGAGTSCSIGLPNWSNLLLKLAAIDDECKKVVQDYIIEKEFEAAAESIVTMLGINVYRDCLHRIFEPMKKSL